MKIYLAGAISGNLNPAWRKVAKGGAITPSSFIEELVNENFWRGGESRHWIQDATSPIKEKDESISGKPAHLSQVQTGGGISKHCVWRYP